MNFLENIPFCGGEGVGGDLQCDCLNSKMPFYEVSLSLFFLTPSGRGLYNGHGSIGRGGGVGGGGGLPSALA